VDGLIAFDGGATSPSRPFGELTNFARTRTDGFEYEAAADVGGGFRLRGTFTQQNPRDLDTGLPLANRAQHFGSAGIEWKGRDVRVALEGFFSGRNPNQGGEFTDPDSSARQHPGRRNLVDLTASWQATDDLTVFGGVRNLLDQDWVATPSSAAGTGISVYVGAQFDF
jgi:outer membrane receptor protein involved in Fe transport